MSVLTLQMQHITFGPSFDQYSFPIHWWLKAEWVWVAGFIPTWYIHEHLS